MIKQTIKTFVDRLLQPAGKNKAKDGADKQKVYQQAEHGINLAYVSPNAINVCKVLQRKGFQAYIVGGAVRDLILGIQPKDFDVATNATPNQIRQLFRRSRIIGRRFQLVHVVFEREVIETSTFRAVSTEKSSRDEHGRILQDNEFGNQEEDALRRDFTINALYYDPVDETVVDYQSGFKDLQKKTVRIIGDAAVRFREDPVRMLRAVRFASKLHGQIEPRTLSPIYELSPLLQNVPTSRLFDEALKLLTCGNSRKCLSQLRELGLDGGILPLLNRSIKSEHGAQFIDLSLQRTDERIEIGKSINPSFLYAALLWPLVKIDWEKNIKANVSNDVALSQACSTVLDAHAKELVFQKRHTATMREIWFMQPRFTVRNARSAHRLLESQRFRAAVDFLQLRAICGEFNRELAQWWMDFADAAPRERTIMLETMTPFECEKEVQKKRPRRRKRFNKNKASNNAA